MSKNASSIRSTTILGIRHNGMFAICGDGQVTQGEQTILKMSANKIRRLRGGKVLTGFAGSSADAITLNERFEKKLEEHAGNLKRASVELSKDWRSDKVLRRLEALMIVADIEDILLINGAGDVIQLDDGFMASPAVSGSALYLRTKTSLYRIEDKSGPGA